MALTGLPDRQRGVGPNSRPRAFSDYQTLVGNPSCSRSLCATRTFHRYQNGVRVEGRLSNLQRSATLREDAKHECRHSENSSAFLWSFAVRREVSLTARRVSANPVFRE